MLPESNQVKVVPGQKVSTVPQFKHNQNLLRKNKEAKSIRLLRQMVKSNERTTSNPQNNNYPTYSCITQEKGTQFSSNLSQHSLLKKSSNIKNYNMVFMGDSQTKGKRLFGLSEQKSSLMMNKAKYATKKEIKDPAFTGGEPLETIDTIKIKLMQLQAEKNTLENKLIMFAQSDLSIISHQQSNIHDSNPERPMHLDEKEITTVTEVIHQANGDLDSNPKSISINNQNGAGQNSYKETN